MSKRTRLAAIEQKPAAPVKDRSSFVPQRDKIGFELTIRQRDDLTDNQKRLIELVTHRDTRAVFIAGPAGTSKTFLSVLAGLMLMNRGNISDIVYIRSVIESASRSLGYLPGMAADKMEPYLRPLTDKLEEMLPAGQIERLVKEKRAEAIPVGYLRGASFNAKFIFVDEAQNLTAKELTTVVTRLGQFSKLIVAGDPSQSDINGQSGFMRFFDLFNDEESRKRGIHCFSFTKDDIVRSGILRYIVERLEAHRTTEPMFPASK